MLRAPRLTTPPRLNVVLGLSATLLVAAATTSACGRQGALSQPAPLFGEQAKSDYQVAEAKRIAAHRAKRETSSASANQTDPEKTDSSSTTDDENAPRSTRDIKDPGQLLTPLSSAPSPGAPDPLGAPPSLTPPN